MTENWEEVQCEGFHRTGPACACGGTMLGEDPPVCADCGEEPETFTSCKAEVTHGSPDYDEGCHDCGYPVPEVELMDEDDERGYHD